MNFDFLTPGVFDALVWAVILIGGALAILRLYRDLSGPPQYVDDAAAMPPSSGEYPDNTPDTQP